jgi:SHS2 domain-containing protein
MTAEAETIQLTAEVKELQEERERRIKAERERLLFVLLHTIDRLCTLPDVSIELKEEGEEKAITIRYRD